MLSSVWQRCRKYRKAYRLYKLFCKIHKEMLLEQVFPLQNQNVKFPVIGDIGKIWALFFECLKYFDIESKVPYYIPRRLTTTMTK